MPEERASRRATSGGRPAAFSEAAFSETAFGEAADSEAGICAYTRSGTGNRATCSVEAGGCGCAARLVAGDRRASRASRCKSPP